MLEKICTDLITSKRLKELGIEGETCFYWRNMFNERTGHKEPQLQQLQVIREGDSIASNLFISAYTLEQILDLLPNRIRLRSDKYPDRFFKYSLKVDIKELKIYYNCHTEIKYCIDIDYNMATSAARLLIKLKEDKLL